MATKKPVTNHYADYKRRFWQLFMYGFLGIIFLFLFSSWGFFGKMPSFDDLENPDSNVATEIISSDGVVIGKFYPFHNGHKFLADTAESQVNHLYIIICGKDEEVPNPILREKWINELYNRPNITIKRIVDIYDPDDSSVWANLTKKTMTTTANIYIYKF
jgi:cytidyltransferase-like protein